jgi:hypothetical protein
MDFLTMIRKFCRGDIDEFQAGASIRALTVNRGRGIFKEQRV